MGAARDSPYKIPYPPTGLARGGTTPDYNATLRGTHERIDRLPEH